MENYLVLARKYRPSAFDDLIGQDAMVRTLRNAFATGRIAQAYMLTGVRGVGKTTTARILARGLNYVPGDDDPGAPTVDMAAPGIHCAEILASRHPDVLEIDAASNTGIDNIREIIETARYRPVAARYKVFIIDEVHMLSKGAFNALLKTLEEPPEHAKFIFATTEVRKVPVTVLSRCQRFDLRRVPADLLVKHYAGIVAKEGAQAEQRGLALIARAAQGSVRDGLSILDQALAIGSGEVTAATVQDMLGLADRQRTLDLLELILSGQPGPALEAHDALYADGAEPAQVMADMADLVHLMTRAQVVGRARMAADLSVEEADRIEDLAGRLSIPLLSRAWALLSKGCEEVLRASEDRVAAEMLIVRVCYTATLPHPDGSGASKPVGDASTTARGTTGPQGAAPAGVNASASGPRLVASGGGARLAGEPAQAFPPPQALPSTDHQPPDARPQAPTPLTSLQDVVDVAKAHRDIVLQLDVEQYVRPVRFAPGTIEVSLEPGAPRALIGDLGAKLSEWTGQRVMVALSTERGGPTLDEEKKAEQARLLREVEADPVMKAFRDQFPDAKIEDIRPLTPDDAMPQGGQGSQPGTHEPSHPSLPDHGTTEQ